MGRERKRGEGGKGGEGGEEEGGNIGTFKHIGP